MYGTFFSQELQKMAFGGDEAQSYGGQSMRQRGSTNTQFNAPKTGRTQGFGGFNFGSGLRRPSTQEGSQRNFAQGYGTTPGSDSTTVAYNPAKTPGANPYEGQYRELPTGQVAKENVVNKMRQNYADTGRTHQQGALYPKVPAVPNMSIDSTNMAANIPQPKLNVPGAPKLNTQSSQANIRMPAMSNHYAGR